MSNQTFVDLCLQGKVLTDKIDDYVDEWHESDSSLTLYQFLGMTEEEYDAWVDNDDNIFKILTARRYNLNFIDVLNEDWDCDKIAARSTDISMVSNIRTWLADSV